ERSALSCIRSFQSDTDILRRARSFSSATTASLSDGSERDHDSAKCRPSHSLLPTFFVIVPLNDRADMRPFQPYSPPAIRCDRWCIKGLLGEDRMVRRHMAASALLVAFGVLGVCGSAWAHHGSSAYADQLTILKNATVTTFQWANPHTIVMFDVKDDKGQIAHWAAEAGSP